MIFLTLTRDQARVIAETTNDPQVLDAICSQMLSDDAMTGIDVDAAPRTVLFRDEGDGLRVAAISFTNADAVGRAWDRFMAVTQQQTGKLF